MVRLSIDGVGEIGTLFGLCANGVAFAFFASFADRLIPSKFVPFCLGIFDFSRSLITILNFTFCYSKPWQRSIAGIGALCWWVIALLCYLWGLKEGQIFLMYLGLEQYLRNYLYAWEVYVRTDGPMGQEAATKTKWKTVTAAYWFTAGTIVYWKIVKVAVWWAMKFVLLPCILGGAMLWSVIRWGNGPNSIRVKNKVMSIISRVLATGGKLVVRSLDLWEIMNAYIYVRIPDYLCRARVRNQRRMYASKGVPYYQYGPLYGEKEFRLLQIEPGTPISGILKTRIHHVSLESPPLYETLSYRWGDATLSEEILINGCRFEVTKSAYDLLLARRSFWGSRLVWCDAICINQAHQEEKTRQVRMMKEIYQKAYRVVVWAGADWTAYLATPVITEMFAARVHYEGSGMDFYRWYVNDQYTPRWKAVLDLFKNPYLNRVWVVQEISVGQQVLLYHGGVYIPWELFVHVMMECFDEQRRSLLSPNPSESTSKWEPVGLTFENTAVMALLRQGNTKNYFGNTKWEERFQFENILFSCQKFKATNPVDKIFALVGIAKDGDHELLRPDYTKSVEQVYFDAAKYVIKCASNPIHMLALAGTGYPRNLALPSWVPDLTTSRSNWPYTDITLKKPPYHASSSSTPEARLTDDSNGIFIRGIIFDRILDTTDEAVFDIVDDVEISEWETRPRELTFIETARLRLRFHEAVLQLIESHRELFLDRPTIDDALRRTLVGDRLNRERVSSYTLESVERGYPIWLKQMNAVASFQTPEAIKNPTPEQLDNLVKPFSKEQELVNSYGNAMSEATYARRFCITEGGKMAIAPPRTRKGDWVAVFCGAQVPFLIRKKEGQQRAFELVGEGYIHGCMDGQVMEHNECEDILIF